MKPRTPNGVALWTTFWIVLVLIALVSSLVAFKFVQVQSWLPLLGSILVLSIFCYYLIGFFIEKFLYAKIKVIYKNIHAFKSQSDKRAPLLMADDVLHDIEDKVSEWVEDKIEGVS